MLNVCHSCVCVCVCECVYVCLHIYADMHICALRAYTYIYLYCLVFLACHFITVICSFLGSLQWKDAIGELLADQLETLATTGKKPSAAKEAAHESLPVLSENEVHTLPLDDKRKLLSRVVNPSSKLQSKSQQNRPFTFCYNNEAHYDLY